MRRVTTLVVCTLALTLCAGYAFAGGPYYDVMKVDYFINANTSGAPVAIVQLTNTGYLSGGNICADVFVFDPEEELQECCSCLLTPNDLRTLSVNVDLTSNTVTSALPTTGSIRVVAAATNSQGQCPTPTTNINPESYTLRTWATHIQTGNAITETSGQDATLSSSEASSLTTQCYAAVLVGSGRGVCTCGTGD